MSKTKMTQPANMSNDLSQNQGLFQRKCHRGHHNLSGADCNSCNLGQGNKNTENDLKSIGNEFGKLNSLPILTSSMEPLYRDIPGIGSSDAAIVDQAEGEQPSGAVASEEPSSGSCDHPRSMNKLTSGAFLGGLTMDSYFPDLAGGGLYNHPGTAGTFDTGTRVGANIQLYGVIASPCLPNQFSLEQTVSRTRFRVNGQIHPREGEVKDDIAKSGRDASRAPFRQDFLGGGGAPLGYIISMADPPSTGYNGSSDIEHDRSFVTSLAGPSGKKSVSWSLSTRISAGTVTRNVLT